ncbi:acyl-CoA dehydrogenase family protein (plasmid) [Burkholderia glumae]|uniref:Acyl-CoA dehydrogenase family protein n=1 Tax=Burkholderia glumae TaxID=337 RepID=A0ABY5BDC0_BURGL|nr:acyl-CoA dehydrogenase family protein [Burkholderia glumae]USS44409.1 acyl-CoA dehydrogenase family protein [Burkholderia glumae]
MSPARDADAPHRVLARLLDGQASGDGAFAPGRLAELDREAAFPERACAVLDAFGLARHYVPAADGGALRSLDLLMQLWRAVARHDLTVAIGHGKTFLGGACIWLAGDAAQRERLAQRVLGGEPVSWGLTERDHGADLLAGELRAESLDHGWRIDGEKWLINNATRGHAICLLARTGDGRDSRALSLFLVDRRALAAGSVRSLPKVRTLGIRGADISGIAFEGARVGADALIGAPGAGVEVVLKALQLTRTACVGLSLGAADHAFSLTLAFVRERQLYGRRLADLPMARRTLGEALAMHHAAEAVASAAARAVSWLPAEMSVLSAISKAFVPSTVEQLLARLGELLGARAYLDDVHGQGAFQKLERDHRIVPIFDGSTVVNRQALINQFPMLARGWLRRDHDAEALEHVFDLSRPAPEMPLARLTLVSVRGCGVVQALPASLDALAREIARRGAPARLGELAEQLMRSTQALMEAIQANQPTARAVPSAAFELARRYELCFAGAACLRFWLHDRDEGRGADDAGAVWSCAALAWVIGEIDPAAAERHRPSFDALAAAVLEDTAANMAHGVSRWNPRTGMERAA